MRSAIVLVACLSCVLALPAYILPFGNARGISWIRRVLDCPPLLYGSYSPYRCRQEERRTPEGFGELTVLEIVEEEPGHDVRVVEDEHAGTFAIKVPHQYKLETPKCSSEEIYVSELDICVEAEEHLVKSKVPDNKRGQEKQKEDKREPVRVLQVGEYEKEKCGPGEIWVPEVAICMDRNPPPPLEPEQRPAKLHRRKKHRHH